MRPHARKGSKRCQSAQEKIDGLKTRMGNLILAKIRRQVVVFDQAHAVVQYYDTDTSSKISCHIQALWRAIMDVEQAIELYGVDVETIEQRCSNKSATSRLSTRTLEGVVLFSLGVVISCVIDIPSLRFKQLCRTPICLPRLGFGCSS